MHQVNWVKQLVLAILLCALGTLAYWLQAKHKPEQEAQEAELRQAKEQAHSGNLGERRTERSTSRLILTALPRGRPASSERTLRSPLCPCVREGQMPTQGPSGEARWRRFQKVASLPTGAWLARMSEERR